MSLKFFIAAGVLLFATTARPQRFSHTSLGTVSPRELALSITALSTTEEQKVYAIFRWITNHINYRLQPGGMPNALSDTSTLLRPLDELVAEQVLQNKLAVCDGYTRLFKTLCRYAGISAEIIKGYAKNSTERVGKRFKSNHTWNAVYIDSTWRLVDVTWASGYVSNHGNYFVRQYEPRYFLTPPEDFIQDHYPEDARWTLLPQVPTLEEFKYAPFKTEAFLRTKIKSFSPALGIIEANVGDTIHIFIGVEKPLTGLSVLDGTGSFYPFTWPPRNVSISTEPNRVSYLALHTKETWLDVVFEEEVLLRYKLIIKEKSQ